MEKDKNFDVKESETNSENISNSPKESEEEKFLKELKNVDKNKIYKILESPTQVKRTESKSSNSNFYNEKSKEKKKSIGKEIFDFITTVLTAAIIAILFFKYVCFIGIVPSQSMKPTINVGERIFVVRTYFEKSLHRGDIVVFEKQIDGKELYLIKRLIGLPGDKITIKENGSVIINNKQYNNRYVVECPQNIEQNYIVPENSYFFLGDNRINSEDSRYWDNPFITFDNIIGKAVMRVAPFDKISLLKNE